MHYLGDVSVNVKTIQSSNYLHIIFLKSLLTFSLQVLSIDNIDKQTDTTDNAGDQSSVKIERHMCPLLYTCGWTGMLLPTNVTYKLILFHVKCNLCYNLTSGESKGYLFVNLNWSWKCSPSYKVPAAPSMCIVHLKNKLHIFSHFTEILNYFGYLQ